MSLIGALDTGSSALAVAQAGLLLRFHRAPGARAWIGLVVVSLLGWFTYPLLFALLVPIGLIYYLSVGARHRLLWHIALLGGLAGAVAANLFWLFDWLNYWWIRAPLRIETDLLSHRTLHTLWQAPLWGSATDRALAVALFRTRSTSRAACWGMNRSSAAASSTGRPRIAATTRLALRVDPRRYLAVADTRTVVGSYFSAVDRSVCLPCPR